MTHPHATHPDDPSRRRFVGAMAAGAAAAGLAACQLTPNKESAVADLIVRNARITTLDPTQPTATAIAVANGVVVAIGDEASVMEQAGSATRIDRCGRTPADPGPQRQPHAPDPRRPQLQPGTALGRRAQPRRRDGDAAGAGRAHARAAVGARGRRLHRAPVRGEAPADAGRNQRRRTGHAGLPAAPVRPRPAQRARPCARSATTSDTPDPPGGRIERDKNGNPTGLLLAKPNALILYATLAAGPKLPLEYQVNSTRHFMRELNRLGITSVIDAGGGFQNYPDDYEVIRKLHADDELTVRIAYNLFTQKKGGELADFDRWTKMLKPREGDDMLRHNGAGEMLVFSAADFEDFREPRPELPASLEGELDGVVRLLAQNRWPFRIHATYDESISASSMSTRQVEPRGAVRRPALDRRPRRDHLRPQHRPRSGARRRHRRAAPHGLPGRVLRRALRRPGRRTHAAGAAHARRRRAGRRWAPMPPAWPATTRGWRCTG